MDGESISSEAPASSVEEVEAFERLYRMHSAAVLRYAVKCVGRRDVAEEITSDAFLALYRNLKSVDASRLPAWLFTVVRNGATSHWRKMLVERKYAPDAQAIKELARSSPAPEPGLLTSLLSIPDLKPVHRSCLILRYAHDMERPEIAAKLGLSENQVKSCLQYGLELLRKRLTEEDAR